MNTFLIIAVVCGYFLVPWGLILVLWRFLHPFWWRLRAVQLSALVPVAGIVCNNVWFWSYGDDPHRTRGIALATAGIMMLQLTLLLSLVVTGAVVASVRWSRKRRGSGAPEPSVDRSRRLLLQGALGAVPLLAAGCSVGGVVGSALAVDVRRRPLVLPSLPPGLSGLRILHLSDLHLSALVPTEVLADILARAATSAPDLVVVTGDLADDLRLLPAALDMIEDLGAPLGAFMALGNHEYGNGIERARGIFDAAGIVLLVDAAVTVERAGARLAVGGVDDPAGRGSVTGEEGFYAPRVAGAFDGVPADFRLLLSHRPGAFPPAARQGIDLVLAGHTHGGQLALGGRSLPQLLGRAEFSRGEYRQGATSMYLSAGAGQWLPFRLGCPAEAPVLELVATGAAIT